MTERGTSRLNRKKPLALLAAMALLLAACAGPEGASQDGASVSLPSPPQGVERQILGDTTATQPREITLYRASDGTMELTTVTRSIRAGADRSILRSALEELLAALPGGGSLLLGGAQATLEDVEFGSGLATVRLSIDASVNRSDQDYLLLCASISNTLLGIDGVEAVNILTGNRTNPIASLPMGAVTEQITNVPAIYAQIQSESERFLSEGSAALQRTACLYFPAAGGQYLLPEVRNLVFTDENYAQVLIQALCEGPQLRDCCFPAVPANLELLSGAPELSIAADGERVLELRLSSVLINYLALTGVVPWQLYGSLVLTLTSFQPELDAVRVSIDGGYVTECGLGTHIATFADGRMRREDFSSCIGSGAYLYFTDDRGGLVRAECAISQASAVAAGSILSAMINLHGSYMPDLNSAFPDGIGAEDVLGVAIEGRTAIVNLSGNFYSQCQSLNERQERALVYAMVNALAELDSIGAVRFLVEGRQVESLVGGIYLRTALMPNPGIVREYHSTPDETND